MTRGWSILPALLLALVQTFTSSVEAVRVDVLVTAGGRVVRNLAPTDFVVRDDGALQKVDFVSFETSPLNVSLALDMSASVGGTRLQHLRSAADALLSGLERRDRAALVTFSHAVVVRHALTHDIAAVRTALGDAHPHGGTALVDAAHTALLSSFETGSARGLVVLFSDGLDTSSWLEPKLVLEGARRSDTVVYAVAPGAVRNAFLADLAETTGGQLFEGEPDEELARTFVRILSEFRTRYVVSYTPRGAPKPGWHRLEVRVNVPGASVTARPGYYRPER
jgi:VWFA-related protein